MWQNEERTAVFLLGYVFAVAKKHLQVSSPSIKWGYLIISNNTSVALGVASGALVEDAGDELRVSCASWHTTAYHSYP